MGLFGVLFFHTLVFVHLDQVDVTIRGVERKNVSQQDCQDGFFFVSTMLCQAKQLQVAPA